MTTSQLRLLPFPLAVILTLSILALGCQPKPSSPILQQNSRILAIVHGRPLTAEDALSRSVVGVGEQNDLQCLGTLIHQHQVLTAAHCVTSSTRPWVYFGLDYSPFPNTDFRAITKITLYPKFCSTCPAVLRPSHLGDLAVVEFSGDLPEGYQIATLATRDSLQGQKNVQLVGYGMDENSNYDSRLRAVEVPLDQIGETEFSTIETAGGGCKGDSGGPAFIRVKQQFQLAGVLSRGDQLCRKVGIYTMPSAFRTWLGKTLLQ